MLGLAGALTLAGCTDPGKSPSATKSGTTGPSAAPTLPVGDSLVWATWPDYIDRRGKRRPTLAEFEAESGVKVTYDEVINDNKEYVDSISGKLQARRPVGADVVTLTSWMASRLVRDELCQPFGAMANAGNLVTALARPDWDPQQSYSMPWQAGLTGIAYDARRVDRAIGSVTELLTRDDLRGKVGLLTEFPDTVGLAMLARGLDLATASVDDVEETVDELRAEADGGRFAGFYGNDFMDALDTGEVAATMAWSGDVLQAQLDNPYLKFVLPEEGLMIWSDNLLIPAASQAAGAATALVDYYYQPEVAARVAAWVNYICPVEGAQAAMDEIDPELAASPLIFPDATTLDRSHQFPSLPTDDDERLRAAFADVAASV